MALKKYRIKNITSKQTHIFSGVLGYLSIEHLTDEQAEILYQDGKSNYIELAQTVKKLDRQE